MSHKKTKNLTLAIHIDSAEVHLAAGYVEKGIGKVNIVALNKTPINGISKGNITNKDTFTNSFSKAIKDFLLQDLTANNFELAKSHGLAIDDNGKYVIERLAFNSLISERNSVSGSYLQSTIVKDILIKEFFPENIEVIQNENLFSCTADVATTNLLAATNPEAHCKEYSININFGRYSTGINFVANSQANQIYSKSIELGFQDLVNDLQRQFSFNPPVQLDEIYNYLKSYQFNIARTRGSIRLNFIRGQLGDKNKLNDIFVSQLQYIFHQCYVKFKELDSGKLRFTDNFINKVNINLMGYGADFETAHKCLALIFSSRLQDELDSHVQELERKRNNNTTHLTTVNTSDNNIALNLATGEEAYSYPPSITSKYKAIIYNDQVNPSLLFKTNACRLTPTIYNDQTYLCGINNLSKIGYSIDQYATALGLIYNFYLAQPNDTNKKTFFAKLCSIFRL